MSDNIRARRVGPMRTKDHLEKRLLWSGAAIAKEQVVRITSTFSSGAYLKAVPAIADGTQTDTPLMVAWHATDSGSEFLSSATYLFEMDTSAAALGDFVYLSATVAGEISLTVSGEVLGWVTEVSAEGKVWIDAKWAAALSTANELDKYRPDYDAAFETLIYAGDEDIHVDGTSGSDVTGDGTPSKPFATVEAAILKTPHNRQLLTTTIVLDLAGEVYTLPEHFEATSKIVISATLPTAEETPEVTAVVSTTSSTTVTVDTDLVFGSTDDFYGYLVGYDSGKYGWVTSSIDDGGGNVRLVMTQNTNGEAYDTVIVTDVLNLYAFSDLSTIVIPSGPKSSGAHITQTYDLTIENCRLDPGFTATGKDNFNVEQADVTLKDCMIYWDARHVSVDGGKLTLDNVFAAQKTETTHEGQFGLSNNATLLLMGGTVIDGAGAPAADNYPIVANNSRVLFSGPVMFMNTRGIRLANGSTIDYAEGYDVDVNTYWTGTTSGAPLVYVDQYDTGVPVRGVLPDAHGAALAAASHIISAVAPCQLWLGRGSTIAVTGQLGGYQFSVVDGVIASSGQAYDGSFIRMDRARTFGSYWRPHREVPTGGTQSLRLNWGEGPSQKYDLSDASNNAGTFTWETPDNGDIGAWVTLEIVAPTNPVYLWSGSFVYAGGVAPVLSVVSGRRDIIRFYFTGDEWLVETVAVNIV